MATTTNQVLEKTSIKTVNPAAFEVSKSGKERLSYQKEGWNYFDWKGYKIHFIGPIERDNFDNKEGNSDLPIFVLLHGYGASAYHWRYNIPELAKIGKVYALDLLGFGWSEKAPEDYSNQKLWPDEVATFVKEVIGEDKKVILVGNSMGGAASLSTAGYYPEIVKAVVLINAAGRFADEINSKNPNKTNNNQQGGGVNIVSTTSIPAFDGIFSSVKDVLQKIVTLFIFWQSKQPERIEQVLRNVYINTENVDSELIQSIVRPTSDPGAADVFGRVFKFNSDETMNDKLAKLKCPLLLVWGVQDPWMGPQKADKIVAAYPSAQIVRLQSGHCPHDESPEQVNQAISEWTLNLRDNQAVSQWAQSMS